MSIPACLTTSLISMSPCLIASSLPLVDRGVNAGDNSLSGTSFTITPITEEGE